MKYRIWYSTESAAEFVIRNSILRTREVIRKKMYESDANNSRNFHTIPDHIKQILYLDAPDIIVERDTEPIFSIEISTEAGTGHNAFQRFARLAASVENNVPAFYIYPEAVIIQRKNALPRWDKINPLVLKALENIMSIYHIPALLYFFPTDFREYPDANLAPHSQKKGLRYDPDMSIASSPLQSDLEIIELFSAINEIIRLVETKGVIDSRKGLLGNRIIMGRRDKMNQMFNEKGGHMQMSPLSATIRIPTSYLLKYLSQYETSNYQIGELLRSRSETIIYKVAANFRGDPYPGAFAAIDYLLAREGKTFEERRYNLVLAWSNIQVDSTTQTIVINDNMASVEDFINAVISSEGKNLLSKSYADLASHEVPRYFMQVRYGSMFSKVKHVRIYAYFADAILFHDGALWRDA